MSLIHAAFTETCKHTAWQTQIQPYQGAVSHHSPPEVLKNTMKKKKMRSGLSNFLVLLGIGRISAWASFRIGLRIICPWNTTFKLRDRGHGFSGILPWYWKGWDPTWTEQTGFKDAETLCHAFTSSQLHYCNSIFTFSWSKTYWPAKDRTGLSSQYVLGLILHLIFYLFWDLIDCF